MNDSPKYTLTVVVPDCKGLVADLSSFLTGQGAFITEANHHNDNISGQAFLRFAFQESDRTLPKLEELDIAFTPMARKLRAEYQFSDTSKKMSIVIAVSKFGHCLYDLVHRWKEGILPVDIKAVISNHENMRSFVEWSGIPYHYLPVNKDTKPEQEAKIKNILAETESELLVLARYMQILSEDMCKHISGKAINIHHSFLPSFKGAKPYSQAFDRGVKVIGATAHYVTADLDEGPIIEQAVERVDQATSADEFVNIGRDMEAIALSRAVRWHSERRLFRSGNKTIVFK